MVLGVLIIAAAGQLLRFARAKLLRQMAQRDRTRRGAVFVRHPAGSACWPLELAASLALPEVAEPPLPLLSAGQGRRSQSLAEQKLLIAGMALLLAGLGGGGGGYRGGCGGAVRAQSGQRAAKALVVAGLLRRRAGQQSVVRMVVMGAAIGRRGRCRRGGRRAELAVGLMSLLLAAFSLGIRQHPIRRVRFIYADSCARPMGQKASGENHNEKDETKECGH